MQFLGLGLVDRGPDVTTVWLFREQLQQHGLVEALFEPCYPITDASVHDSQVLGQLLDADNSGDGLWADSASLSVLIVEVLKLIGFKPHINERTYRHCPLSEEQKTANREGSKTRTKVEHVFGELVPSLGGKVMRSTGLARAQTYLGLKN
jgi:IS5 family transposase